METDAEHVDAEPAPARDDITKDGERHQSPLFHKTAPATVQNYGIPDYNHEGAIFFGIPAPEAAPRLVGPDAAEHRADEAEKRGEADDAVDHAGEGISSYGIEGLSKQAAHDINNRKETSEKSGGVASGHNHDVRREPKIRIKYGAHHFERIPSE